MSTPAQPSIDDLALDYLQAIEAGQRPRLDDYLQQLADPAAREELRALIAATARAKQAFPAPFRSQTVIADRYELLDELGSGGFGKVWRAVDTRLQRTVAIKLFHPVTNATDLASSLRREQQALARVTHDGIVRLLDSGVHEGAHFLVMEYVEGRSLERALDNLRLNAQHGRLDRVAATAALGGAAAGDTGLIEDDWPRTAARITAQMLWALAAAHASDVVHRDLKPGNVLLRPGGRPVLLDFGLAGLADQAQGTFTLRLFGTAAYLAPEQLERDRTGKDVQIDVYQCGLLLYELLTLRRAFDQPSQAELLECVRHGRVAHPRQVRREVPEELADICLRAIERDPARRYASADAFRDDLERWLAGEQPVAARFGELGRAVRSTRRFARWHRNALLLATVALVGAGATMWAANRKPDLVELTASGQHRDLLLQRPGFVCAIAHVAQPDGSKKLALLRLAIGDATPRLQVSLNEGQTTVRLEPLDGRSDVATARISYQFEAEPDMAEDWQQLFAAAAEQGRQGPLTRGAIEAIATELQRPGRGVRPIRNLPIAGLLDD